MHLEEIIHGAASFTTMIWRTRPVSIVAFWSNVKIHFSSDSVVNELPPDICKASEQDALQNQKTTSGHQFRCLLCREDSSWIPLSTQTVGISSNFEHCPLTLIKNIYPLILKHAKYLRRNFKLRQNSETSSQKYRQTYLFKTNLSCFKNCSGLILTFKMALLVKKNVFIWPTKPNVPAKWALI